VIKIKLQPEPTNFREKVREPGENVLACLAGKPLPHKRLGRPITATKKIYGKEVPKTIDDFHPYWQDCLEELYQAYGEICAYYGQRIQEIANPHVDHYAPNRPRHDDSSIQSADDPQVTRHDPEPVKAYEWDNFRLASPYANSCKGNWSDVLDPVHIEDGWFQIVLHTWIVRPDPELEEKDPDTWDRVGQSIKRLKLSEGPAFRERKRAMELFRAGDVLFGFLEKDHPFLAKELARQRIRRREDLPKLPDQVLNAVEPELRLSEQSKSSAT
jgi:hypothetical protein